MIKFISKHLNYKSISVKIGDTEITLNIADSFLKRLIGLINFQSLDNDKGMLFTIGKLSGGSIWMYKMKFPIDIIWLDKDENIIKIEENAKPCNNMFKCKMYYPEGNPTYVIEVNSGFVKSNNIDLQSKVIFGDLVAHKSDQ